VITIEQVAKHLDPCVEAQVLGVGFSWVEWASDNPHGYSLEVGREIDEQEMLAIECGDEDE
jgi:hypothetical protein